MTKCFLGGVQRELGVRQTQHHLLHFAMMAESLSTLSHSSIAAKPNDAHQTDQSLAQPALTGQLADLDQRWQSVPTFQLLLPSPPFHEER